MTIEAIATVYSQDFKPGVIETGIVSTSDEEPEKSRRKWRMIDEAVIETHLLAHAETD